MTWPIDSRQPDVAEVERFLAAVSRDSGEALPDLIAIDLAGDSFRGLVGRRLMDPPEPEPEAGGEPLARIAPPLALIMTARSRPAFVVQCALDGEQRGAPRMYGIAEDGIGLRAVLLERATADQVGLGVRQHVTLSPTEDRARADDLHQLYKYLLQSPDQAVQVLASWLTTDQPGGERTLDLYRHRNAEQVTRMVIVETTA